MFFSIFCIEGLQLLHQSLSFLIGMVLHVLPTAFLAGKLHCSRGMPLSKTENALKTVFQPLFPAHSNPAKLHGRPIFSTQDVNTRLHYFVDKFSAEIGGSQARRVDNHVLFSCAQHLLDMKRYFQTPGLLFPGIKRLFTNLSQGTRL